MNKDKIIFSIGIFISLMIISVSGWLYYKSEQQIVNKDQQKTEITQTPSPTEKPQVIDYKNQKIEVLNGSGKAGLAKVFADKLTKLGFTKVTTGNYEKTVGNLLFAPRDFGADINLEGYKYQKSETIKIILGN